MSDDRRMDAEQRYVAGSMTLRALSQETGIPLSTLQRWCKADGWVKKREKARKRAMRKAVTRATDKKAKELSRLLEASDAMERALLTSAKTIAVMAEEKPDVFALTQSETVLNYSKSLEKLASARNMTGGAISAADRERLDLLRRKQEMDERKEAREREAETGGVTIRLEEIGEETVIE